MAEKTKARQNKSANISIDDEIQIILVKNPEKDIDTDFLQELTAGKLVKNKHEMETDQQTFITEFAEFEKYVLEVIGSSIETNQSTKSIISVNYTKYLHTIISDLQNVIKVKTK